jgi:uncharacterized protein
MKTIALLLLRFYKRFISPIIAKKGVRCKFYPSCSTYSRLAIEKYGVLKGSLLTVKRLRRCRPDNFDSCIDFP